MFVITNCRRSSPPNEQPPTTNVRDDTQHSRTNFLNAPLTSEHTARTLTRSRTVDHFYSQNVIMGIMFNRRFHNTIASPLLSTVVTFISLTCLPVISLSEKKTIIYADWLFRINIFSYTFDLLPQVIDPEQHSHRESDTKVVAALFLSIAIHNATLLRLIILFIVIVNSHFRGRRILTLLSRRAMFLLATPISLIIITCLSMIRPSAGK
jgi:hypothetical protein